MADFRPGFAANLIAWPVAYYYLHRWLESYADRISLASGHFLAAGTAALLIAWATVYANTLRLARTRPDPLAALRVAADAPELPFDGVAGTSAAQAL